MDTLKHDNRGLTLVELLVAFAISAIVLSGIAYMIITSLKLSQSNNANVEVQSEVQTTMNLILDNIMEANGMCLKIPAPGENTDCILFGETKVIKNGADYTFYYKGNAMVADIVSGSGELYLVEFPNETFAAEADGYCKIESSVNEVDSVSRSIETVKDYISDLPESKRIKWLLAQNITECMITPDSIYGEETVVENGVDTIKNLYTEPFTLSITISAESDYGFGKTTRTLKDRAAIRNRIDKIYLTKPGEDKEHLEAYDRKQQNADGE